MIDDSEGPRCCHAVLRFLLQSQIVVALRVGLSELKAAIGSFRNDDQIGSEAELHCSARLLQRG